MTVKDMAKSVIDSLPQKTSMDDIIHALYVHAKFTHGEQEIKEGKGISQSEVVKRIKRWVK